MVILELIHAQSPELTWGALLLDQNQTASAVLLVTLNNFGLIVRPSADDILQRPVSTWMGDRLGIQVVVGILLCPHPIPRLLIFSFATSTIYVLLTKNNRVQYNLHSFSHLQTDCMELLLFSVLHDMHQLSKRPSLNSLNTLLKRCVSLMQSIICMLS